MKTINLELNATAFQSLEKIAAYLKMSVNQYIQYLLSQETTPCYYKIQRWWMKNIKEIQQKRTHCKLPAFYHFRCGNI